MNKYKLSKAGISASEAIKRFDGNIELYEKCLNGFLQDTNFEKMCDCMKSGDANGAFCAAHSLKGISGNLSMKRLYADINPLVEQLRNGNISGAMEFLDAVRSDYDEIINSLK